MYVKARVVGSADTIIDPWTVVVVSVNASIANVAMATLWETNDMTERAQALRVKRLQERHHTYLVVLFNIGSVVSPNCEEDNQVSSE